MKPRIFIGSSTEGLAISYAIQENLQFDANVTVWTQGIFQLSSNALDDLIKALDDFDFAIMIFKPDDLLIIRNTQMNSVRDNVIFELGLFIGKLGKENVFFVTPIGETSLHIPTDLKGVNSGLYDNNRQDGNLKAALGPFCNQIREKIKNFIYENLNDLREESKESKKIAIEKPPYWEYLLAASLIEHRLISVNLSYEELDKNLFYIKSKRHDKQSYIDFFLSAIDDIKNLVQLFYVLVTQELVASFGPPGLPGKVLEIKEVADKFNRLCKNLIDWEYSAHQNLPPDELTEVREKMKGWSKILITEINKIPSETRRVVEAAKNPNRKPGETTINISIKPPENLEEIHAILDRIR